jgi:hypothetical protein
MAPPDINTPRAIAIKYCQRGWNPVPLPYRTKKPTDADWQERVIREEDVARYFNGQPQNIGVLLGPSSGGLTDLDLDCGEAVALASWVLPRTAAIFGRTSKRASHWLFRTDLADTYDRAVIKLLDPKRPDKGACLLEVRIGGSGKGAQTVFPGSIHDETGEAIAWEEAGEPAGVDGAELVRRAKLLASCCLFARYWPGNGSRHDSAGSK